MAPTWDDWRLRLHESDHWEAWEGLLRPTKDIIEEPGVCMGSWAPYRDMLPRESSRLEKALPVWVGIRYSLFLLTLPVAWLPGENGAKRKEKSPSTC